MNFNLIVIGAGPGGYETAAAAARKGLKTALIERDELGGTCLNRGCIPTKTLCHAAHAIEHAASMRAYGLSFGEPTVDFPALIEKKDSIVSQLREGISATLNQVEIIRGEASFNRNGRVEVNGQEIDAERIIIATGSKPASLPIAGSELAVNSDFLLSMRSLPSSMVIIGGGVIGLEFASIYNTLGVETTVVEYCKEILPAFDTDIAKRLRTMLSGKGIKFHVGAEVTSVEEIEDGWRKVNFSAKGKVQAVAAQTVVMAVGRRPVLPDGIENIGIEYSAKGIKVNPETFETTRKGIYAVGDVNGLCMLAHAATAQGLKVIGENVNTSIIPSAVFTTPEVAAVGLTEQQCMAQNLAYRVNKTMYGVNGRAVSMDASRGMVKSIIDTSTNRLLGCHVLGAEASAIVQEATLAMANDLTVDKIKQAVHIHPTLSELLPASLS